MSRSSKKGPYVYDRLLIRVKNGLGTKENPIKTWSRESQIPPDFVNKYFIENGISEIRKLIKK